MAEITVTTKTKNWTAPQAAALAAVCLLLGGAGGWMLRQSLSPATVATPPAALTSSPAPSPAVQTAPNATMLKSAADTQAAPLLEQLKTDPENASLLSSLGDLYYDSQQYPAAIEYYQRALKVKPANTDVRTDLATAYWYIGNADSAIAEFNKSLSYDPNKANTLFNLGIVQLNGKKDGKAAIATWQKLLETNPNYPEKEKVLQLMAQARNQ